MIMTDHELEARLIFSLLVAGKSEKFARQKMAVIMSMGFSGDSVFMVLKYYMQLPGGLDDFLRACKTGNYGKLCRAIPEVIKLDPRTCTLDELEAIHGIGPKTSRFFLLWTRPGVEYAALDTHILKWLRSEGIDAPKSTPPDGGQYQRLEKIFLQKARDLGLTARDLDARIWTHYSSGQKTVLDLT